MTPDATYPPGGFYFQLQFADLNTGVDNAFQEVSGLEAAWDVEEVREGGLNTYTHPLPTVARHPNLVLRRGFVASGSALAAWCETSLTGNFAVPVRPHDLQLSLLNADGTPLAVWVLRGAWPVKWSISEFRAQEGALAIETMEFSYNNLRRV